jgi:hypothetical protein
MDYAIPAIVLASAAFWLFSSVPAGRAFVQGHPKLIACYGLALVCVAAAYFAKTIFDTMDTMLYLYLAIALMIPPLCYWALAPASSAFVRGRPKTFAWGGLAFFCVGFATALVLAAGIFHDAICTLPLSQATINRAVVAMNGIPSFGLLLMLLPPWVRLTDQPALRASA